MSDDHDDIDPDDEFPDETEDTSGSAMAALLAGTAIPTNPDPGELVSGTIISIGAEDVFVDIGATSEATIAVIELLDDDGDLNLSIGDSLEATVVSLRGGIRLARKIGKGGASGSDVLDGAYQSGLPVEGRVEESNKGGFTIMLPGNTRAFCPISQIDSRYVDEPELYVGQTLEFLITEMKGRRDVVVSRRQLLKALEAKQAEETRKKLVEGAILKGTVASLMSYGAFVELGGLQGLIHISQLSHTRVDHPSEVVQVGDEINVKVLKIDNESGKIGLGLKQLSADPWDSAESTIQVGTRYDGRVSRVAEFGAFVELVPGIDGLLHVSELAPGRRNVDPRKIVEPGQMVRVEVKSLDLERRRVSLLRVDAEDSDEAVDIQVGALLTGTVERVLPHGVVVRLGPGKTGLIKNSEMATKPGSDHRRDFPTRTPIEVEVLSIEADGRDIRLSRKAAQDRAERARVDEFQKERGAQTSDAPFSSMAEKLRSALDKK